jgi:hypothetical protein
MPCCPTKRHPDLPGKPRSLAEHLHLPQHMLNAVTSYSKPTNPFAQHTAVPGERAFSNLTDNTRDEERLATSACMLLCIATVHVLSDD